MSQWNRLYGLNLSRTVGCTVIGWHFELWRHWNNKSDLGIHSSAAYNRPLWTCMTSCIALRQFWPVLSWLNQVLFGPMSQDGNDVAPEPCWDCCADHYPVQSSTVAISPLGADHQWIPSNSPLIIDFRQAKLLDHSQWHVRLSETTQPVL